MQPRFRRTAAAPFAATALVLSLVSGPAAAQCSSVTMGFDGVDGSVGETYAASNDIHFSPEWQAGDPWCCSGPPSPPAQAYFPPGPTAGAAHTPTAFRNAVKFWYASAALALGGDEAEIQVWSGLDGTGTILQTVALPDTPDPYFEWTLVT